MNDITTKSENGKCGNIGKQSKKCLKCGVVKPNVDFNINRRASDGRCCHCRECSKNTYKSWATKNKEKRLEKQRDYRKNNKEEVSRHRRIYLQNNVDKVRTYHLKQRYGITVSELEGMFVNQNGQCAICQTEFLNRNKMHIDHDHTTGNIRKLLCGDCNRGLGGFKDNPDILTQAINYLKQHTIFLF